MSRGERTALLCAVPRERGSGWNRKAVVMFLTALVSLVVPSHFVLSETAATGIYNNANRLYEEGKYEEAISEYGRIIDLGIQNGHVYYNLGNAYFQTKQLGPAILSYERAARLMPRDEDVRSNLEFIRLLTVDKIESPQPGWISHLITGLLNLLSLSEATVLAWILYVLFTSALIIFVLTRNQRVRGFLRHAAAVLLVLLLVAGLSLSLKIRASASTQQAIVMAAKVDARSGPGEEYTKMFTLHEGTKVRIRQSRPDWFLVSIPGGTGGWVQAEAVERI